MSEVARYAPNETEEKTMSSPVNEVLISELLKHHEEDMSEDYNQTEKDNNLAFIKELAIGKHGATAEQRIAARRFLEGYNEV